MQAAYLTHLAKCPMGRHPGRDAPLLQLRTCLLTALQDLGPSLPGDSDLRMTHASMQLFAKLLPAGPACVQTAGWGARMVPALQLVVQRKSSIAGKLKAELLGPLAAAQQWLLENEPMALSSLLQAATTFQVTQVGSTLAVLRVVGAKGPLAWWSKAVRSPSLHTHAGLSWYVQREDDVHAACSALLARHLTRILHAP